MTHTRDRFPNKTQQLGRFGQRGHSRGRICNPREQNRYSASLPKLANLCLDAFSANRLSRLINHLVAKSGDVLIVRTPPSRCCNRAALSLLQQPFGANRDPVQCIANNSKIIAASLGQDQPLSFAMEEL